MCTITTKVSVYLDYNYHVSYTGTYRTVEVHVILISLTQTQNFQVLKLIILMVAYRYYYLGPSLYRTFYWPQSYRTRFSDLDPAVWALWHRSDLTSSPGRYVTVFLKWTQQSLHDSAVI